MAQVFKNPLDQAKAQFNEGKISQGQLDDVAIAEFEKKKNPPKIRNPRNPEIDNLWDTVTKGRIGIDTTRNGKADPYSKGGIEWYEKNPDALAYADKNRDIFEFVNKNRDYFKSVVDYNEGIKNNVKDFKKSPEFKKYLLDSIFSNKDISFKDYLEGARSTFANKYNYDIDSLFDAYDTAFNGIGRIGQSASGWGKPDPFAKHSTLDTALQRGALELNDIRDYFSKPYEEGPYSLSNNPLYWAERVYDEPGEYSQDEIALAKRILSKWGGI